MLVREGQRQEGASTIEDSPGDCIENVDCIINRRVVHSHGSLYLQDTQSILQFLTFSSLVFLSSQNEDYSLVIDYRAIGVHAICHSPDIYKHHCIYCQVSDPANPYEGSIDFSPGIFLNEDMMVEEEADSRVEEVFFAPNDPDQSMSLFQGASIQVTFLFEQISTHQAETSSDVSDNDDFFLNDGALAFDRDVEALFRGA